MKHEPRKKPSRYDNDVTLGQIMLVLAGALLVCLALLKSCL